MNKQGKWWPLALAISLAVVPGAFALEDKAGTVSRVKVTPPPAKNKVVVVSPAVRVAPSAAPRWGSAGASMDGLRDSGRAAIDPQLDKAYALSGFNLRFGNGDHKLRRIGVLARDRFSEFALADSNGDDPFNGAVKYTTFSSGQMGEVTAEGGGKFEIPLPGRPPADSTLVLSGFEFRRSDGTDANLRNIGIWLDSGRNVARVSLVDDQGMDFRGFEHTIGAVLAGGALPGLLETSSIAATANLGRQGIRQMVGRYRGYRVALQYAWIPNSLIEREGSLAGTDRSRNPRPPSQIHALQGFEFTFNNSDHHLLGFGVNGRGAGDVFFQDNNTDDPLQWSLSYLTLRDNR